MVSGKFGQDEPLSRGCWFHLKSAGESVARVKWMVTYGDLKPCCLPSGYDCYIAMVFRWPIEIDGIPLLTN